MKCCHHCKIEDKFGDNKYQSLFSGMMEYDSSMLCDVNGDVAVDEIVKPCVVKLTTLKGKFAKFYSLPPNDVTKCSPKTPKMDTSFYCHPNNMHIDTLPDQPPTDTQNNLQLKPNSGSHTPPFGIHNPKNHCYLNSVVQVLFSILKRLDVTPHFDSSTKGFISKCLFITAVFSSKSQDVDVLKTRLTQYDNSYNGLLQQDATECLLMIIEIIKKGSVTCFETIENIPNSSSGVSLSDFLFLFILEKCIVCDVCEVKSPTFESSSVLHITPTHCTSMQELVMLGVQQNF